MTRGRRIALLGAAGFVGSAIGRALDQLGGIEVMRVSRGENAASAIDQAAVVIHCANPARRFQAESDPRRDFEETVEKTTAFLKHSTGKRFLLISTLSCRTQPDTNYGLHRLACEQLALVLGGAVVRLGPMFGGNRTKDSLHDIILGNRVFVAAKTRYAYVDVDWAGKYIASNIDSFPNSVVELGARNTIELGEIARILGSRTTFGHRDDTQFPIAFPEGPNAELVLEYANAEAARVEEWRAAPDTMTG